MIDTTMIEAWLGAYERAWRSDEPHDIAQLFEPEARYRTAPWREPYIGVEKIIEWWIGQADSTVPWTFQHEVLAREGDLFIVKGVTGYPEGFAPGEEPLEFDNIWLVTLSASGKAREFVEYWMQRS